MNKNDLAITDLNKTIALNPKYSQAYLHRGILMVNNNDYNSAIKDFNKAILINPQYAFAYYDRAKVKLQLHDNGGACLDFNKANDLGFTAAQSYLAKYCK